MLPLAQKGLHACSCAGSFLFFGCGSFGECVETGLVVDVVCSVELSGFLRRDGAIDVSDGQEGEEDCELDGCGRVLCEIYGDEGESEDCCEYCCWREVHDRAFLLVRGAKSEKCGVCHIVLCPEPESNWRPSTFQADALPTELSRLSYFS